MPNPSWKPLVAAIGVTVTLGGFIGGSHLWVHVAGVAILLFGIYAWAFEPAFPEHH